jgi:uncharacterized membrane protein
MEHDQNVVAVGPREETTSQREDVRRLAAFSDAVFAIAMTLMVLDLDHPNPSIIHTAEELRHHLAQWTQYETFVLSFAVIGIYWQSHFRAFRRLERIDNVVLLLNLLLLMIVTFVPFPTSVLEDFSNKRVAIMFYAGTIAALGFVWAGLWGYAASHQLMPTVSPERYQTVIRQLLAPPVVFTISIAIAFYSAEWAVSSWLLIVVAEVLGPRLRRVDSPSSEAS